MTSCMIKSERVDNVKNFRKLMLICAVMLLLCVTGCTKDGYVASKVFVGGVDIGSMSREEAISALSDVSIDPDDKVTIVIGEDNFLVTAEEVGAVCNVEETVDYAIENSTGFFSGLFKKELPMKVELDTNLLEAKLTGLETEVVQTSATVVDNGIQVTRGTSGKKIDRDTLCEAVSEQFGSVDKDIVRADYIITEPEEVDYNEFLSAFGSEFKEAEYVRSEDGSIVVTEECAGVVFDMNNAISIMKQHTNEGEVFVIPCEVTLPQNSKADLEEKLFRDVLGTYSTSFASSSANRASNISLATSSINGIILLPGEVFSFNGALGERTTERGYKTAGAYVAGETVDQVGGGICQVSSTLYNTVLLSNLEIVERRSHQMTVSYVPMGRDATVNWGTTDFKFKNNTAYPVKIVGTINGKNVAISAMGTATIENMKVEIVTNTVSVLEPQVETVEDPLQPVGYTSTKNGSNGYVVDAVRVVYSNGAEVSRENLVRSKYNSKKTVVTVGTMVVETPTEAPTTGYEMPPGLIPVGDASNGGV